MKYGLEHIERVGSVHIGGGILTLLVGIISWIVTPKVDTFNAIVSNILPFVFFGFGWFLISQFAAATVYSNLLDGNSFGGRPMLRLKMQPEASPTRLGLPYLYFEYFTIAGAIGLVILFTIVIPPPSGLSLGGFFAGWLVGGGFGRIRWNNKVLEEETGQKRRYYFSDSIIGPRTEVAYYSDEPEEAVKTEKSQPTVIPVSQNLTATLKKNRPSHPSARPKAQPLISPDYRRSPKKK